jgi:hypothetical protein
MAVPVLEIPESIRSYCERFSSLFYNRLQYENFERYLTGLILCENVTVDGISGMFPEGPDQSNLNRFLTEAPWDEEDLNTKRLRLLQERVETRWGQRGVIAIDDTLNRHDGKYIELVAKLWDHSEKNYTMGHNLVTSQYVGPRIQYPITYRLFLPEDVAKRENRPFKSHIDLGIELVHDAERRKCPAAAYAFDIAYTVKELTDAIERYGKGWVGSIKLNRWVEVRGKKVKVGDLAKELPDTAFKKVSIHGRDYWAFSCSAAVSHFDHKIRIVISYDNAKREGEPKIFVSNMLTWEIVRILSTYDCRATVETFYRDSKQELGLDGYELRREDGFRRHWFLVFAAYSCLLAQLHACGRRSWITAKLLSIGEARRKLTTHTLKNLVHWIWRNIQGQGTEEEVYQALSLGV